MFSVVRTIPLCYGAHVINVSPEVSRYMAEIGRKGGSVVSQRKVEALRQNARKPRPGRTHARTLATPEARTHAE